MGFSPLDYVIVIVYLAGVTAAGIFIAGRQKDCRDYFWPEADVLLVTNADAPHARPCVTSTANQGNILR